MHINALCVSHWCLKFSEPVDLFGRKIMLIVSGILTVVGGAIQTASFHSWYDAPV